MAGKTSKSLAKAEKKNTNQQVTHVDLMFSVEVVEVYADLNKNLLQIDETKEDIKRCINKALKSWPNMVIVCEYAEVIEE